VTAVDLERFKAGYLRNADALNRHDVDTALGWIRPEFEWHVLGDAMPAEVRPLAPPVLRGPEEARTYFEHLLVDWGYRLEPHEFEDPGDGTVVVRAVGLIQGRASQLRGEVRFTQVWRLDENGWPVRADERLDDYFLEDLPPADAP
jgi:SnoaL-like protein